MSVKWVASSVAAVQFSSVHRHISPNLEPDHWSSLGKSPNLNLNLPERFFWSGSGFGEVENPNRTEIFYFIFIFYFWKALNQKNIWVWVHRGSQTGPKVQSEGMQTCHRQATVLHRFQIGFCILMPVQLVPLRTYRLK